jgi:hypothetical protein
MTEKTLWNRMLKVLVIYILVVLMIFGACFVGLVIYYLFNPSVQQCGTKECFMAAANECQDVKFTSQEMIGTVKYSSKDCVFTKTLAKSGENELPEVKALLEGKSLTCEYKIGEFDKRWVTTLIYGINYCEGGLKETLGKMLLLAEPAK